MEAKFFAEIEKKMDVKTVKDDKDFEREVRTKINHDCLKVLEKQLITFLEYYLLVNVKCG